MVAQLVEKSACIAGDPGSIPGSGRSPGEGNGNPLQYSGLENPMDRGPAGLQSMGSQRVRHDCTTNFPFLSFISGNVHVAHRDTRTFLSFVLESLCRALPSGTSLGLPAAFRVRSIPGTGLGITRRGGTEAPGRSCLERDACRTQPWAWNSLCELSILPRRADGRLDRHRRRPEQDGAQPRLLQTWDTRLSSFTG